MSVAFLFCPMLDFHPRPMFWTGLRYRFRGIPGFCGNSCRWHHPFLVAYYAFTASILAGASAFTAGPRTSGGK